MGLRLLLAVPLLAGLALVARPASDAVEPDGLRSGRLVWSAHFDRAGSACDFSAAGWDPYEGDSVSPPCPAGVGIVDAGRAGLPPLAGVEKVARFVVRPRDAAADPPRYHAKLFRPFYARGRSNRDTDQHSTRSPRDVSGSYRAWFFLPRSFRIPRGGWRNIMQFKERFWNGRESGYRSEPTWWLELSGRDSGVVAGVRYWNGGSAGTAGRERMFPRGRWVEVRADIRQGDRIEWFLDGRPLATGRHSTWPVSPTRGRRSLAWNFGVGNYAGMGRGGPSARVSGPLYIGAAELRN